MPNFGEYKHDVPYGTLYQLYIEEGLSSISIGKRLGIPQNTISRYLRKVGLSDKNRRREQIGAANTNWKGGLSKSTVNRQTKRLCEENDIPLHICEVCQQEFSYNLNRHHVDRNRANNKIANVVVVCPSCHAKEHEEERCRDERGRYL